MTWLLTLYPPRWRRRYGAELAELVRAQPFSLRTAIDLLAGAADAWVNPQLSAPSTAEGKGDVRMIARLLQFECAGYGPHVSASDKRKSASVMIGGALGLTFLWLWALSQVKGNAYLLAIQPMAFFFPYLFGLHYTSLKGRSPRTQVTLIGGLSLALTVLLLLAGWMASL